MTYLCIIFVSPLYFVLRKQWGAFVLNAILYGMACVFLISIIGAVFAPIFWALAVGHAGWHLRHELMTQQAELIAQKMAEQLRQPVGGQPSLRAGVFCTNCGAARSGQSAFCQGCGRSYLSTAADSG